MSFIKKVGCATGATAPIGLHTYWTAPVGRLSFTDFELLTLIAGPILFKKACGGKQFWLMTDNEGFNHLDKRGLLPLYDKIGTVEVSKAISPNVFWAAGKIMAYSQMPIPFVTLDFDAYVTRPFWEMHWPADVMPLCAEPKDWNCYRENRERFGSFYGFSDRAWKVPAHNVGVAGFFNERLRDLYVQYSMEFMTQFSQSGEVAEFYFDEFQANPSVHFEEQVFAEQRLLGLIAADEYYTLRPITTFDKRLEHCAANPYVVHLWTSKKEYLRDIKAREHFIQSLLVQLWEYCDDKEWGFIERALLPCVPVKDVNTQTLRFVHDREFT